MSNEILAWHFLPSDKMTRFENPVEVTLGETLKIDPEKLVPCKFGLHGSIKLLDALSFLDFNNAWICRVKLAGKILEHDNDKLCASERTVIAWASADRTLHEFAVWCAREVLTIFENKYPNDKRPRQAIEAKEKWLDKKITTEELAAALAATNAAREKQNNQLEKMFFELLKEGK